jgi:hypothetical protein
MRKLASMPPQWRLLFEATAPIPKSNGCTSVAADQKVYFTSPTEPTKNRRCIQRRHDTLTESN